MLKKVNICFAIVFAVFLLVVYSCEKGENNVGGVTPPTPPLTPEIEIALVGSTENSISFSLSSRNAVGMEYRVSTKGEASEEEFIMTNDPKNELIIISELKHSTAYTIDAQSFNEEGEFSKLHQLDIPTKGITLSENKFHKKAIVVKFTGTWCKFCPDMTDLLNILKDEYPNDVEYMAIHSGDILEIEKGRSIQNSLGVVSLPAGIMDYRDVFSISDISTLGNAIETSLNDYPANVGIAIDSKVEDSNINISVKTEFNEDGDYKVVCALLEDGIELPGIGSKDGIYDDVLRYMFTDHLGDELSITTKQTNFSVAVDSLWKIENMKVLVYVLKSYGSEFYSSNAISCEIGGSVDFQ